MRPVNLTLSAFGPYPASSRCPSTSSTHRDSTSSAAIRGAGKTTFVRCDHVRPVRRGLGQCARNPHAAQRLRRADAETFVELKFEYRGKVYRIRRSPAYERPKLRGRERPRISPPSSLDRP